MRRAVALSDTLFVPPPKVLTIPEHPQRMDSSGTSDSYIQPKPAHGKAHESFQLHAQSGSAPVNGLISAGALPRRGFGSGPAAMPDSPAAAVATAAAAAFALLPSSRRSSGDSRSSADGRRSGEHASGDRGTSRAPIQSALQKLAGSKAAKDLNGHALHFATVNGQSGDARLTNGSSQQGTGSGYGVRQIKLNSRSLEQRVL
jgi:hypothetical protein